MPGDERSHAGVLQQIQSGGLSGDAVARLEGRHGSIGGNALRAVVLGANDGLVSNLSLVMGAARPTTAVFQFRTCSGSRSSSSCRRR